MFSVFQIKETANSFGMLILLNGVVVVLCLQPLIFILVFLVAIVGLLQRVPLGNRASWRGQHVRPVTQFRSRRVATENDFTDGIRRADAIVIDHRNH